MNSLTKRGSLAGDGELAFYDINIGLAQPNHAIERHALQEQLDRLIVEFA